MSDANPRNRRAAGLGLATALWSAAALQFLGAFSVLWPLVLGFFVYFKLSRSDRALVWLRRFHRREPDRFRFNIALNRACSGLCVPITLQDTSFQTSYFAGAGRTILLVPLVPGLGVLATVLAGILVYFSVRPASGSDALAIGLAILAAVVVAGAWFVAARRFFVTRGFRRLESGKAREYLDRLLSRIQRRKGLAFGVLVLKAADDVWRDVVALALSKADVALIDISS